NYVRELESPDTSTKVLKDAAPHERESYTVMRVVRSWSENYATLSELYRLISDITQKQLSRKRADQRLATILSRKKPYSRLALVGAHFLTASSLTVALGGSWGAGLSAGIFFAFIYLGNFWISLLKMPGFFTMVSGSALITLSGLYVANESSLLLNLAGVAGAPYIVAAGLIILLPTSRMVSTIQDALTGFPLTAAGKFVSTGVLVLGIVVGFSSAIAVLKLLGLPTFNIQDEVITPGDTWRHFVFMLIASASVGMIYFARWRNLLWIVAVSATAIWVFNGVAALTGDAQERTATFISAVVVGMLSTYLAHRLNAPASCFYVPSLTFLLPGLAIFRGMCLLVIQAQGGEGLANTVTAVIVILSMASGVVLGGALMQYLMQKFMRAETLEAWPMTHMMPTLHR
ncbi:MAG: threonine/serine exporter family protein, partial [Rothia sp. (in: high G+C Gram-positive bacteria)]|nr:threonine/serine exporter family protein [Rothia sp. (in: high G+C Gram-positive bacteria)]